ncbi:hypothetical protein B0H14DRAFT_226204 [Mycena olivaceomarginata]|nr:hypothetical protein B0H14DRAFT_226204 [Mycena olivaceomarginata]
MPICALRPRGTTFASALCSRISRLKNPSARSHRVRLALLSHQALFLCLYHFSALSSVRKYGEQFSNGVTIISLYLNPLPGAEASSVPPIELAGQKRSLPLLPPRQPLLPPKGPRQSRRSEGHLRMCVLFFASSFSHPPSC